MQQEQDLHCLGRIALKGCSVYPCSRDWETEFSWALSTQNTCSHMGTEHLSLIGGARTPALAQEIDMLIETHILKDHLTHTCVVRVRGSMFWEFFNKAHLPCVQLCDNPWDENEGKQLWEVIDIKDETLNTLRGGHSLKVEFEALSMKTDALPVLSIHFFWTFNLLLILNLWLILVLYR